MRSASVVATAVRFARAFGGCAAALAAAMVLCGSATLGAQVAPAGIPLTTLRLAVDDSATGQPLGGARVILLSQSTIRRADDLGRATFANVPVGYQRVRVSAIGYYPVSKIIAVSVAAAGDSSATLIDLEAVARDLDTVTTTAHRATSTASLDDGGFDMRRKMGIGHFLDTDQIDREAMGFTLAQMVQEHVPGMRDCGNVCSVRMRTQGALRGGGGCPLDVYLDGIHQSSGFNLGDFDPSDIAAMEVYTMAEAPVQYKAPGGGNSSGAAECGVLLLWLRN